MPYFDKNAMKKNVKDMQTDIESGDLTTKSWLWVLGGGLLGLVASCIRFSKKGTEPILARFDKSKKNAGGLR